MDRHYHPSSVATLNVVTCRAAAASLAFVPDERDVYGGNAL